VAEFRAGKGQSRAHIVRMPEFVEWLTGTHTCSCGAKYKVTVTEASLARINCEKCGVVMDHPADKSLLAYERIPGDQ
jgi:hypothetical protein